MHLIFETPSKKCPYRIWNGREVEILAVVHGHRFVRRLGRFLPEFIVSPIDEPDLVGLAFADELHVEVD